MNLRQGPKLETGTGVRDLDLGHELESIARMLLEFKYFLMFLIQISLF